MTTHWFWLGITIACLVWYSIVTIYVTVKGGQDIREMLRQLALRPPKNPEA